MRKIIYTWLFLSVFISFIFFQGCTSTPELPEFRGNDWPALKSSFSRYIEDRMKNRKVRGLSLVIVDEKDILWECQWGVMDASPDKPVSGRTLFRIGSVSKLFTAMAALRLAEEGKLDLDKPVQIYIPEFAPKSRFPGSPQITVRMLMTHHSGLPTDFLHGEITTEPIDFSGIIEDTNSIYVAYPPGYMLSYSNLAMSILGIVVERVSGQKYVDFMDEQVLKPLGMTSSSFSLKPGMEELFSKGFHVGKKTIPLYVRILPAGGMYSNTHDMAAFLQMILNYGAMNGNSLLKKATVEEMLRPQNEDVLLDFNVRIGLNWILEEVPLAGRCAWHSGSDSIFYSTARVYPDVKLGIFIAVNSDTGSSLIADIEKRLINAVLEVKYGHGFTGKQAEENRINTQPFPPISRNIILETNDNEGIYGTSWGILKFKAHKNKLAASLGGATLSLTPREDDWYSARIFLLGFIPVGGKAVDTLLFGFFQYDGKKIIAFRQDMAYRAIGYRVPRQEVPVSWIKRLGEYTVSNAGKDAIYCNKIILTKKENYLTIKLTYRNEATDMNTGASYLFTPVDDTKAIIAGLGRSMNETVEVKSDKGEEILCYSGYQFLKKGR